MYDPFETEISFQYLKRVINKLKEPICLLGGWAVYLIVNNNFSRLMHRDYIGSRDIDLGFHVDKKWSLEELNKSAIAESLKMLEKELGFKPLTFRLFKQFHIDEKEEISHEEAKSIPMHLLFPLYVDLMVDNLHPKFKEAIGLLALDEPLLKFVFEDKNNRTELNQFTKKLWLPKPTLLLATKINSVGNRDKEHKIIKDICDIYALISYSGINIKKMKQTLLKFLSQKKIDENINKISKEEIKRSSSVLDVSERDMEVRIKSLL